MMKSELPDFKEIYNQYLMKIIQIPIEWTYSIGVYDTHIDDLINDESINNVEVFLIKDERIVGNIPHKIWWDDSEQQWVALYYTTEAVEIDDRPLKDDYCCFMVLDAVQYKSIGYHVETKLLMDQIKGQDNRMYYVLMFSYKSKDSILKDKI